MCVASVSSQTRCRDILEFGSRDINVSWQLPGPERFPSNCNVNEKPVCHVVDSSEKHCTRVHASILIAGLNIDKLVSMTVNPKYLFDDDNDEELFLFVKTKQKPGIKSSNNVSL